MTRPCIASSDTLNGRRCLQVKASLSQIHRKVEYCLFHLNLCSGGFCGGKLQSIQASI